MTCYDESSCLYKCPVADKYQRLAAREAKGYGCMAHFVD